MPVDSVDLADAADEEFEFPLVEGAQQSGRDELMESLLQREELLLDAPHEPVGHIESDVLAFVVFVDRQLSTVALQVVHLNCSVGVVFH